MAGRAASRAGFTLMEIVVAVGAVALVAVGLASIFDTVGKTVSGGKRVSNLNTYAGLLEKQMRSDFEAMSRDGFLVIRNQWVDNLQGGVGDGLFGEPSSNSPVGTTDTVPVSPDATTARPRRIDEILFFVNGQFTSARQPLWSGAQATSNVAEVYYGHGQMTPKLQTQGAAPFDHYWKRVPNPQDRNVGAPGQELRLGIPPSVGQPADSNPNYYAGNWTLLRHLTLLAKPGMADSSPVPLGIPILGVNSTPANHRFFRDQPTQIALQPAATSIFRSVATNYPNLNGDAPLRSSTTEGFTNPVFGSGIIDIATCDLSDIRGIVTGGARFNSQVALYPSDVTGNDLPLVPLRTFSPESVFLNNQFRNVRPSTFGDLDFMQAWMSNAFPTESRNKQTRVAANDFVPDGPDANNMGTRMRYEPESTDLLASTTLASTDLEKAEARADQLMLSRTGIVPHCSEFIVEWSFGNTEQNGQVIWHGLNRHDSNGALVAHPSPWDANDQFAEYEPRAGNYVNNTTGALSPVVHPVTDRLIYGYSPISAASGSPTEACLTGYFGWTDPTFDPTASVPNGTHYEGSGTLPWAWPRLIRVTVTLSDPQEPAIESTFQYIFSTPEPKH
jgi:type II secretory pathway pseudopilin PulG